MNFKAINEEFKLIDQENASVFVPLDIDIHCYGDENNFSEGELKFAENNNLFSNESIDKISGEKVWDLYVSLINNKELNFSKKQIELKKLNGIISKFVFSVFIKKSEDMKDFFDYNEDLAGFKQFQYFKLRKEFIGKDNLYSFEGGLNEKILNEKNEQTFEFI